MLAKNEKKSYFDAHFHYFDCISAGSAHFLDDQTGCSSFHSKEEWTSTLNNENFLSFYNKHENNLKFALSYGIHPLQVSEKNIEDELNFVEQLANQKKLNAIGECGFDFFTKELKENFSEQIKAFEGQLNIALKYNLTMVIHCRKANEKLFEYAAELKKLPAVLFHSFMGTPIEAQSLIKRGIKAYFSFGKQVSNGNKKVIDCVKNIPIENLLLETDAPYQTLKGETYTSPGEIKQIYEEAFRLRKDCTSFDLFCEILRKNYFNLYSFSD